VPRRNARADNNEAHRPSQGRQLGSCGRVEKFDPDPGSLYPSRFGRPVVNRYHLYATATHDTGDGLAGACETDDEDALWKVQHGC
jgi:hypothetical protein